MSVFLIAFCLSRIQLNSLRAIDIHIQCFQLLCYLIALMSLKKLFRKMLVKFGSWKYADNISPFSNKHIKNSSNWR